jgi:hypothetical protein
MEYFEASILTFIVVAAFLLGFYAGGIAKRNGIYKSLRGCWIQHDWAGRKS